ncbi:endoglucanase 25 [Nicotiana attenuata]|uniref:Endoglucanase 25 n=1 Tax=Nicotiana attenuata TaxID=49451 RepID=A0A1J6JX56_NICAT|nr:endoglucanase 25 [Nicotiana attenuata]
MPHKCGSTALAVESDLEDGDSKVDKVLDGNPKRTIDKNYVSSTAVATNFLVPFTSREDLVPKEIVSPAEITHPFGNVISLSIYRNPCLWKFFDKKVMMANEVSKIERYVLDKIWFVGYGKPAWDEEFALIIKQPSLSDFRLVVLRCILINGYATLPYGTKKTILMDNKLSLLGDVILESCLLSIDSSELVVSPSGAFRLAYPFPCGGVESVLVFCLFKPVTRRPREEIVCYAHVTLDSLFNVATIRQEYARSLVVEVLCVFHQFGWITATAYYASPTFYLVDISRRIASIPKVIVDTWFSPCQRLKGTLQLPKHDNVQWGGKSYFQDGKYDDFTKCKYLKRGYCKAGDALHLNFPQTFVLPMLSWSVIVYGPNYEAAVELIHFTDIRITVSILLFFPVLLWPMELSAETQDFYHHNPVQREVNVANTSNNFHFTEFMILWRYATGMFALVFSFKLLLIDSKRWQARSYEYTEQVKLIYLLLCTQSHNDQSFDWLITGTLDHIIWSSHKACLGFEIMGWELAISTILN